VLLASGEPQKAALLAVEASETFKSESDPANELRARIALAQALLAAGRPEEASAEIGKSAALQVPDRLLQIYLAIAAARVQAPGARQAALERLRGVVQEAAKIGARHAQFEAELAVVTIGNGAGSQLSTAAELLQKEAGDFGYNLIAREAAGYVQH
jgi:hypothetical protein